MPPRGPVIQGPHRGPLPGNSPRSEAGNRHTVIVTRPVPGGGLGDLPPPDPGPFETDNPRDGNASTNNRLSSSPAVRELSVHPAEGVVPVQYGGPLRVGGYVIFAKRVGAYVYVDFAIGEGELDSISNFRWGDKTASALGISTEVHLGAAGDTTSTLISVVEPTYTIPEGIAHVACRFRNPTQAQGAYNPFDFTAEVQGVKIYNPLSGITASIGYPVAAAYDAMTNNVYGVGGDAGRMDPTDWAAEEQWCEDDIGGGIPRWFLSLRIDQQDTAENWLKVILGYSFSHLRWISGIWGIWSERPANFAQDNEAVEIVFRDGSDDHPELANLAAEISYVQKGVDEVPTVVTVDYTDLQTVAGLLTFVAASVQIPPPGTFDTSLPWIEEHVSMFGIMSIERARRWGTEHFNIRQLDKDITLKPFQRGWLPIPGDRVKLIGRSLIPASVTPPNLDSVAGVEEARIVDIKLGPDPVMRAGLYRDATYGDDVDTSDPPNPPDPPPDPDAEPDCPASLEAPHATPSDYGMIIVEPPTDESIISYYDVRDLFGGGDVSVGVINPPFDPPLSGDGKYHKMFPTLVHVDGTGTHLNVRVDSVSYAANVSSGCSTTSWDEGLVTTGTLIESASYTFLAAAVANTSYNWKNYTRVLDVTKKHATTIDDPINDFFLIPSTEAQGVICPKMDGHFVINTGGLWASHADTAFRAFAIAKLAIAGGGGLHTCYITIDAGGTGYLTGEALTFTGGSLATGGFHGAGTIFTTGGTITGIVLTEPMIGWTSEPTIDVDTAGGTGAVLTFHLPAAFEFEDLNFDCTTDSAGSSHGAIWDEDIKPALSGILSSNKNGVMMSMHAGAGLLFGVQQGSGGALDIYDETDGATMLFPRRNRLSIFRVPPADPLSEEFATCPPPE